MKDGVVYEGEFFDDKLNGLFKETDGAEITYL